MDWGAWSRAAVALMSDRMRELCTRYRLAPGSPYHWDLEAAAFTIGDTPFRLITVGTVEDDSFLWAWADDSIPAAAKVGLERVRQFGIDNGLDLLVTHCAAGGLAQAKECVAIAGRVLDAAGFWIEQIEAGFIVFLLCEAARPS